MVNPPVSVCKLCFSVHISLIQTKLLFQRRKQFYGYDSDFSQKQWIEVKKVLMMDLFLINMQLFTSLGISYWTGVVWITGGLL